ncbi:MAG TPA: LysR family transcriptional regulator [Eoetvoesiella sp.]
MARNTPPLNTLRVFEAAARLGSFTKASEELFVSQSAVSRQVSLLERYVGLKLFHRHKSGVSLTTLGKEYYSEIGPAFGQIVGATDKLLRVRSDEPLIIRVYSTFAAKWLMRRLFSWQAAHPDIKLRISTALNAVDFTRDSVDASIEVNNRLWPEGTEAVFLFNNEVTPVCSPLLIKGGVLSSIQEIYNYRHIHSRFRPNDWALWLQAVGLTPAEDPDPLMFSDSLLAYQAAADGLGIAMGQPRFLKEEFDSGKLICPCPYIKPAALESSYHFVTPRFGTNAAKARVFLEWLINELQTE